MQKQKYVANTIAHVNLLVCCSDLLKGPFLLPVSLLRLCWGERKGTRDCRSEVVLVLFSGLD